MKKKDYFFSGEKIASSTTSLKRIGSANAIILYGLSPGGISRFRNLQMCVETCEGYDFSGIS